MVPHTPQLFWVPQEVFWDRADRAGVPIDYRGWCVFQSTEEKLQKMIGVVPPNQDLTGEDDPPGPVSRWYGVLGDVPILLDFHHDQLAGPSVVLHHGNQSHARALVRETFRTWGEDWQESLER